jgi:hypothetical protein
MIEKFINWYNVDDGEKKILQITVIMFMLTIFLEGVTAIIQLFNG